MSPWLSCFLITFCVAIVATREFGFRFDYHYNPNIEGWLKLHLIPASWQDAFTRCELEGAVLASPSNLVMISAMSQELDKKNISECGIHTGVHAIFSKGYFFSIDGLSLEKMPLSWAIGEPNNANNNEDCILFLQNNNIADVNCSELFPFMCYKKKTKDMVMTTCGTVDKDYKLNPLTRNCYKFHPEGTTWQHAYMTCAAEGAYLAIINSPEEAQELMKLRNEKIEQITSVYKDMLLVGIAELGNPVGWRTIHGEKLKDAGYADWSPGQPDLTPGQNCGAIFNSRKLDNFWCTSNSAPFVCEKSPDSLLSDDYNK